MPKLQFDMLCIVRIILFSITTIIFDSMTLFDVIYFLLIAVFLIFLLPYALSALSRVSFFYSPLQTHNLSNTVVPAAF